jgi:hypothetical protein
MQIQVRTDDSNGKLLFEWDADNDIIEIVRKDEKIRVKLYKNGKSADYRVVDRSQKSKFKK